MTSPRFTFCIPNLNKIQHLPACIESMLAQDYSNWQCIFVDGYSTDGSWEYMQQFASDSRFLIRRGLGQGMYADWNECLRFVDTDYFYFLTSDDTCSPALASTTMAALDIFPLIDVCHFQFDCIDETGLIVRPYRDLIETAYPLYAKINNYAHLRSGLCEFMMHFAYRALYQTITSLVFRRRVIDYINGFSMDYGAIGDYDWTMRLGLFTDILYLPKNLATWRIYADQATEDAMLPHITANLLAIARKNLSDIQHSAHAQRFNLPLCDCQLLADLHNEHACSLVRHIYTSRSLFEVWKTLYVLLKAYPFYPLKKIINRLSHNTFYSYQGREIFAQQLIAEYDLPWPATPVDYLLPQHLGHSVSTSKAATVY